MEQIKNKILDQWIMIEYITEGSYDEKSYDKLAQKPAHQSYYDFFYSNMLGRKGVILLFDIFESRDFIEALCKKYGLNENELDSIKADKKFTFALCFDENLSLKEDLIFFTWSGYIFKNLENFDFFSKFEDFTKFENDFKVEIKRLFTNSDDIDEKEFFDKAFETLQSSYVENIEQARYKFSEYSLEEEFKNMHSFFINDLMKAKTLSAENLLKTYLAPLDDKIKARRINLDNKSPYNKNYFEDILSPSKYTSARYPSNTKHSLSLMQQVALNLIVDENYENVRMKSVNGPPGTGKTTLLKDVFAELVCKQSYLIASKKLSEIKYEEEKDKKEGEYNIGILPQAIADNGIFVVSSNNAAVQNIVNELPLLDKIDENFKDHLLAANYFIDTANSISSSKQNTDNEETNVDDKQKWGLFSLEGGKKSNVDKIINSIKCAIKELAGYDQRNHEHVYREFLDLYNRVEAQKIKMQEYAEKLNALDQEAKKIIDDFKAQNQQIDKKDINITFVLEYLQKQHNEVENNIQELNDQIKTIDLEIDAKKLKRPSWICRLFRTKKYKKYIAEIEVVLNKKIALSSQLNTQKTEKNKLNKYINEVQEVIQFIDEIESDLATKNIKKFDYTAQNSDFQKTNPWFNEEYRKMQTELFILSLKVRKHFLSFNIQNLRFAMDIWNNQRKQQVKRKPELIRYAWHWINMVIPVISSTFASVGRMCENLNENSMGHLFVDEAGQAVPQAAVGAIFRSKYVSVVGDPFQIEPVSTIDKNVLNWINAQYNLPEDFNTSVQELIDKNGAYGYKKHDERWIGIPLWVHRRCKSPMFDISNEISYDNNMVQGIPDKDSQGQGFWINVKGSVQGRHYVEKQYQVLLSGLENLKKSNINMQDIFVISPFKAVADKISRQLKEKFKEIKVGTVHTFQGKEAKIVFLVLGCDNSCIGAARWAMGSMHPNIMNVAATRAKNVFFVIGDKDLFSELKSSVIRASLENLEVKNI
ncbi:DNA helicase [Mycoplasmopsis mucosicanis]|uniref:DNA helicase n=1 Tax=Mycoplasmopsis mucosicanis TaxID=458208 RepID=A0A507SJE0_9BACT|nr:AAA domain-containing protein [Mycoplasmopsis mucosicanis]TQC51341.1 DNA helicase [Mycoplasmopsis mucosicanis]